MHVPNIDGMPEIMSEINDLSHELKDTSKFYGLFEIVIA